jgi:hypothetical protein
VFQHGEGNLGILKPRGGCNSILNIVGFMHEFWTISTVNVTYTRSQDYTNMMVGKHEITIVVVVVVVVV